MVRIETPIETPMSAKGRRGPSATPGGPPSPPPSYIDRVPDRADPSKRDVPISARPPTVKAFAGLLYVHSVKFYDRMISRLIAEVFRG